MGLGRVLKKAVPSGIRSRLARSRFVTRLRFLGTTYRCPLCNSRLRTFKPMVRENPDPYWGNANVPTVQYGICPVCRSETRHRLYWEFLTRQSDFFDGKPKRVLHIAPEGCLWEHFRKVPKLDYLTADLDAGKPRVMTAMDITNIQFPDDTFDVVICSHVLEHVVDDRRAMRELCRVLRPDGWALLQVPMAAPVTFEDPSVTDPEERLRLFGQHDHVRCYGPDYVDRLKECGFRVNVLNAIDVVKTRANGLRMGVHDLEQVFLCRTARSSPIDSSVHEGAATTTVTS
jgi:hypothetical protein